MEQSKVMNPCGLKVYLDGKIVKGVTGFEFAAVAELGAIIGRVYHAEVAKNSWGIKESCCDVAVISMNSRTIRVISDKGANLYSSFREGMSEEEVHEALEILSTLAEGVQGEDDDSNEDNDQEEGPVDDNDQEEGPNDFASTLGQNP